MSDIIVKEEDFSSMYKIYQFHKKNKSVDNFSAVLVQTRLRCSRAYALKVIEEVKEASFMEGDLEW